MLKQKLFSAKQIARKNKIKLIILAVIFALGFFGIGFIQNQTKAEGNDNELIDVNFYVLVHDENGDPVPGVKVNAYDDPSRTRLLGSSEASNANGWAHFTALSDWGFLYFKPDLTNHPGGYDDYVDAEGDSVGEYYNTLSLEDIIDVNSLCDLAGNKGWDLVGCPISADQDDEVWWNIYHYAYGAFSTEGYNYGIPANYAAHSEGLDQNGAIGDFHETEKYGGYAWIVAFMLKDTQPDPEPSPSLGNLQIAKTTSDNNTSTSFNVKITLSGTSTDGQSANTISGTYGDATFDDGIATISIKGGQTKNITGLPAGINYSIEETNPGDYAATYTNQTGTITKDHTKTTTITNNKIPPKLGNLKITKTTSDNNTTDSFNVTVTLSGTSTDGDDANTISGQYGDALFNNGVANFAIKHNQTINITGLPAGLNFAIEEEKTNGYASGIDVYGSNEIRKNETTRVQINNTKVKDFKIKKVDQDGNPVKGAEFDVYQVATCGGLPPRKFSDIGPNTDFENPNRWSLWKKGGFTFGWVHYFQPKSKFSKYGETIAFNYIYTDKLIFKDGTTLEEFLDAHHRVPEPSEYNFEDIDYKATKWHVIDTTDIEFLNMAVTPEIRKNVEENFSDETLTGLQIYSIANAITEAMSDTRINDLMTRYNVTDADFDRVKQLLEERYIGEIELDAQPFGKDGGPVRLKIGSYTTNNDGEIVIKDLIPNFYDDDDAVDTTLTIKETKVPEGYTADQTEYTADIREQDEITIVNKKIEEEPAEKPKQEPKETPVEVINPKTEDKKLTTLIIMMGSAVMLFGAIVTKRRHHI